MSKGIDMKTLCMKLLQAESESAVEAIIAQDPILRNPKNWKPLDGRDTNFNVTSNQASDGGKALTELMTNMVDAVLMKHAYKAGIDPKAPTAPATMYEAIDKLIKPLQGGKLVNLKPNDPWLRDFAQKNLVIGVSGAKSKREGLPCYTFADNGEGQSPDTFERTFLSLKDGNKRDIPFVQGKYNMGSSGVLSYCGKRWFKLIVSRRHDGKSPWGWTLMRRRPSSDDKMPVAEFFVGPDGKIPSFEEDALYPLRLMNGNKYDRMHLSTGTVIKLYDYQLGSKFSGFRGPREALNENLVETMLPFRLLDMRQMPTTKEAKEKAAQRGGDRADGVDARPFYGMEFLLLRSHREEEHDHEEEDAVGTERMAVAEIEDPALGRIVISAIPLKRDLPGWLKPASTNSRVFHTVNGQVQFKQTRGYLAQSCGFSALKDRVVVIVDASGLSFGAHNDIWKGDREHIRNTLAGEDYKEKVTTAIKDSEVLKKLQHLVAKEELERATKTERNDLFQKLVTADPTLAHLLNSSDPVINVPSGGGAGGGDSGKSEFKGKYSPTFLRIDEKTKKTAIDIPLNRSRPITARTDVENGYLQRADNKGVLILNDEITKRFSVRSQLVDGKLTVSLRAVAGAVAEGDTLECQLSLQDPAMPQAVTDSVTLRVVAEEKEATKKDKKEKTLKAGDGGDGIKGNGQPSAQMGLPATALLTRDGRKIGDRESEAWGDSFNETDGGLAVDLGDGQMIYKINWDNVYHLKYRMSQRGDTAKEAVSEKYLLGMLILMMGLEHALRMSSGSKQGDDDASAEFRDEFRQIAARGAASTVLALAENLPKIMDTASASQDVE